MVTPYGAISMHHKHARKPGSNSISALLPNISRLRPSSIMGIKTAPARPSPCRAESESPQTLTVAAKNGSGSTRVCAIGGSSAATAASPRRRPMRPGCRASTAARPGPEAQARKPSRPPCVCRPRPFRHSHHHLLAHGCIGARKPICRTGAQPPWMLGMGLRKRRAVGRNPGMMDARFRPAPPRPSLAGRLRRLPERPADSPECATMPPKRLFHGLRRIRPANPSAQTIGRNRSCLMPTQPKNYPPDWA